MSIDENAKPITRYQNFLAAIANDPNAKQLKPITRKENILASAAGNPDAKDIEPLSYDEYYLKRALESGGGAASAGPKVYSGTIALDDTTLVFTPDADSPTPALSDFDAGMKPVIRAKLPDNALMTDTYIECRYAGITTLMGAKLALFHASAQVSDTPVIFVSINIMFEDDVFAAYVTRITQAAVTPFSGS